jgi:hypothetical protein
VAALATLEAQETEIDQAWVELEREERVAKKQASDATPKMVGRRFASPRDSVMLCAQAEQQLPFQEFVLDLPFLPALCHRLAMPQNAASSLPCLFARGTPGPLVRSRSALDQERGVLS